MIIKRQHKINSYTYMLKNNIIFTFDFSWVNIKRSNTVMCIFPNTIAWMFVGFAFIKFSKKQNQSGHNSHLPELFKNL